MPVGQPLRMQRSKRQLRRNVSTCAPRATRAFASVTRTSLPFKPTFAASPPDLQVRAGANGERIKAFVPIRMPLDKELRVEHAHGGPSWLAPRVAARRELRRLSLAAVGTALPARRSLLHDCPPSASTRLTAHQTYRCDDAPTWYGSRPRLRSVSHSARSCGCSTASDRSRRCCL